MVILGQIYQDIKESYDNISNLKISKEIFSINKSNIKEYITDSATLFPTQIKNYIIKKADKRYLYTATINKKNISINFFTFKESERKKMDNYNILAFMIINLLSCYTDIKCSKNLEINIFLTDFKRILPKKETDIIGPLEINGGFSNIDCINNSNITIYRKEEWFKVLIHELFHNFDLDFSTINIDFLREKAFQVFKVKSKYNLYEAYCETWARILNVAILSFFSMKINNLSEKNFLNIFHTTIDEEIQFSIFQSNKILKRFNSEDLYSENSNVFCYYILTSALLFNLNSFLSWCHKNNKNLFRFKKTKTNLVLFFELLIKSYRNSRFQTLLINPKNFKDKKTLRMSYVKINDIG